MNFTEAMTRAGRYWDIYIHKDLTIIHSKDGPHKLYVPTKEVTTKELINLQSKLRNDLVDGNFSSPTEAGYIGEQYALCCELLDDIRPYIETQFTFAGVKCVEVGDKQYQPGLLFTCSEAALDILRASEKGPSSYAHLADVLSAEMSKITLEVTEKRK